MNELVPSLSNIQKKLEHNKYPLILDKNSIHYNYKTHEKSFGSVIYNNKSQFENDLVADNLLELQNQHPLKYSRQIANLQKCSTSWSVYVCPKDQTKIKIPNVCDNRYCKKPGCVIHRICKTENVLTNTFTKVKALYHFAIGSNLMELPELRKSLLSKFIPALRKIINPATHQPYKALYVAVFDQGKKNYKQTGKLYKHFHFGFFFEKISSKHFIKTCKELIVKINPKFIEPNFQNAGWRGDRKKEGDIPGNRIALKQTLHYFSKRNAGEYGHGKKLYYLADLIDLKEFFLKYSNRRFLTFSKGLLVYKSRKEREGFLCPFCKTPMDYTGTELMNGEVHGLDPPNGVRKPQIEKGLIIEDTKPTPINFNEGIENFTSKSLWEVKEEQNK